MSEGETMNSQSGERQKLAAYTYGPKITLPRVKWQTAQGVAAAPPDLFKTVRPVAEHEELRRLNDRLATMLDCMTRDLMDANKRAGKLEVELLRLQQATSKQSRADDHEYHGPVKDGKTIPDEVHENFHRAVGDVIAGKVIPAARKQMQDALNRPVPNAPTTATKSKPMPGRALSFGKQQVGIYLP